jgi:ribose transport system substrate-binding protein
VRHNKYFIATAARVLDILESFGSAEEELSITEIAWRTKQTYSSAFRLLHTLEQRGYVMRRPGKKQYLLTPTRRRYRIGYAGLRTTVFHREVTTAMADAARSLALTLVTRFNDEFNVSKALSNADQLLEEGIDLLVEYQYSETASHLIAAKCHKAGIPAIGINFAQPGAYYFGGNNYETGRLAGEFLGRYATEHWEGHADACLVMPAKGLSSTREAREKGLRDGLRQALSSLRPVDIITAPEALTVEDGYEAARKWLRQVRSRNKRLLFAAFTDHLGLGAERAIREAGLASGKAVDRTPAPGLPRVAPSELPSHFSPSAMVSASSRWPSRFWRG